MKNEKALGSKVKTGARNLDGDFNKMMAGLEKNYQKSKKANTKKK